MERVLLFFIVSIFLVPLEAQEDIDVSFHGFVGVNATVDTRTSVMARNRHVYLYPLPEDMTDSGHDLNAISQFDIDAAHSRFGLHVSGPEVGEFSTSAMIEGDFVGNGAVDSYFRLRHAFVTFSKERWSLLAGQTWHPMFVAGSCPGTVNVNAGTPFHPLIRSPQLRFTWEASSSTQLLLFLVDQNNFRSSGFGSNSTEHALMPEVDAQMKWQEGGADAVFTAGYKTLAHPINLNASGSPQKVSAYHFNASFKYQLPKFILKLGGVYGTNLSEMVMLGGIGRSAADDDLVALSTGSIWTDIQTNSSNGWQPGLFVGYTANMGAHEVVEVQPDLSRSEGKVASLYAFSPRLKYIIGKAWVGAEWLYSTAAWGSEFDGYGVPVDTEEYANHRFLLSLRYNF